MEIAQVVEARQVGLGESEVWLMLAGAVRVTVGRGAKMEVFIPSEATRSEILAKVMGRSGTLRAPTLKIGSEFLVGYVEEMYRHVFAGNS
ncbi:MAG: hypothetical protein HGA96_07810 [Desulfobulbaceae bacterium]|nr:hypothetical protein [Desulfobulbaceae bacterium]